MEKWMEEDLTAGLSTEEGKKSKGLGDSIAKLVKAIGIKPCGGCQRRRDKLNKRFPYKGS